MTATLVSPLASVPPRHARSIGATASPPVASTSSATIGQRTPFTRRHTNKHGCCSHRHHPERGTVKTIAPNHAIANANSTPTLALALALSLALLT